MTETTDPTDDLPDARGMTDEEYRRAVRELCQRAEAERRRRIQAANDADYLKRRFSDGESR